MQNVKHDNKVRHLNNAVAKSLNYKNATVTGFDLLEEDNHNYVVVTAKGKNELGEKVEYVAAKYETEAELYNQLLKRAESVRDGARLDDYSNVVLDKLLEVVENAKLVGKVERADITYTNEGEGQIMNVSAPKIEGNTAYYYIVSLHEGVNEKGETGLVTHIDKVSFELTKEIEKDPSVMFTLGTKGATIEALGHRFVEFDTQNINITINNSVKR